VFVGIEAKAPGEEPTPRQAGVLDAIHHAGGFAFVIDDDAELALLKQFLDTTVGKVPI
jgi:hypothetical protein